jgi:hypothetical protein
MTRIARLDFRALIVCSLLVLACSALSMAQTGSIAGTVTDSAGAVVNEAQVTVTNTATGDKRTATSEGSGTYSIPSLAAGTYEISVTKTGFKTYRIPDAQLTVGQVLGLNVKLEPGVVTEEIQVNADQIPDVDTESSQVSTVVDQRKIVDLPLITRNPYELILLSPGTSQTNALGGITVNGARERNNNFLLDGVDNNDTSVPGGIGGVLSANPDSTQEFRVITDNFNAEYGRNTGAIVDVVTKSGTNSFHGGAYEFGRWNGFGGARDWFNAVDQGPQNPYVRNQFGYSIGGPIFKNKTFFFFNQEFQRYRTTSTNSVTVPTAAFKTGVFNYQPDPSVPAVPVDLTQNGANNGTEAQLGASAPLDPTVQKIFALYPNPTIDNGDGLTGTLLFPSGSKQNSWQTDTKIDHRFTDRETLAIHYGYNYFNDPNAFPSDQILPGLGGESEKALSQAVSASLTSTLSNNLLNTFTFGWNRIYANFGCQGLDTLNSVLPSGVDAFGNGWDVGMSPFVSFGCLALVSPGQYRVTGTTSYTDNFSWVHGAHTLKFGGDFRNVSEQGPNSFFSRRQVGLTLLNTFGIPLVQGLPVAGGIDYDTVAIEEAADALYGIVANDFQGEFFDKNGVRKGTDNKHFRQHEYDFFAQDTWKLRHNLTLNLGVRYQYNGVPFEEDANFSNAFGDLTTAPITMTIVGPGTGKQLYDDDHTNIEPRVGFSWDPWSDGKTAIRGAFGIFHDRVFGNLFGNARGNPPFEQDYQAFPADTINGFYGGTLNGPFVLPAAPETIPSPIIDEGAGLAPVLFDGKFRNAASYNWTLGIQRELSGNNTIDLSYVASKGVHVYREMDPNSPDPQRVQQLLDFCVPGNPMNTGFGGTFTRDGHCSAADLRSTNLYLGADFGTLPFNAVAHNALFQPFFQISNGNANYHSFQTKFTHRFSQGLQAQLAYTWAHAIDDSNDSLAPAVGNRGFPRNSRRLDEEKGNSDNDVRHVAVINYIWEMPFGKGKAYANSGVVGKILEGWQLSGLTTLQSGHPFDVFTTTDMERTGLSGRADLTGDPYSQGTPNTGGKVYITNPAAFSTRQLTEFVPSLGRDVASLAPAFEAPGSIGRNRLYGPGFVNFDVSLAKKTKIGERFELEFRTECYNIFNHAHFENPGFDAASNNVTSPNFGVMTATVNRPDGTTSARQLQVALKLNF